VNFTSKSRYALKIMLDLAHHAHLPHVHRRDIAKRQGIPSEYMDQILLRLRSGGLVASVRGRGGGYRLAKTDEEITLWELFSVAEGSLQPVQCIGDACSCRYNVACITKLPWQIIYSAVKEPLENLTLRSLRQDPVAPRHQFCPAGGVRECRPPQNQRRPSEVAAGGVR